MYFKALPEAAKELRPLAKALMDSYPDAVVEFGIEDELVVTITIVIHTRLLYIYTAETQRREGHASNHIQALLNRNLIDSACCPQNSTDAVAMLAKKGFTPVGQYYPLSKEKEDKPYINFKLATESPNQMDKLFLQGAECWVENGLLVDGLPFKI